jgi:hypothetical protein
MNRFDALKRWTWSVFIVFTLAFALAGCEGDDGAPGADGANGADGAAGLACWDTNGNGIGDPEEDINGDGVWDALDCQAGANPVELAKVELCASCHSGAGQLHQDFYDLAYNDESKIALTITSVGSADNGNGTFTVTANFSIIFNGLPWVDTFDLANLDQKRFYAVQHFAATQEYLNSCSMGDYVAVDPSAGLYSVQDVDCGYAPELSNAQVYGYVAEGELFAHEGGTGAEIPTSHVHLYDDVSNSALAFGTAQDVNAEAYVSAANAGGCEKCHGTPYLKHGYRAAQVEGIPDFAACKVCHYDDRSGGHEDWQYMVDEPFFWATKFLTVAQVEARYPYTANIMNDVHMSHAMEFPYPQSMQNCATCHGPLFDDKGVEIPGTNKLGIVLADEAFTPETCLSCHPAVGEGAWPKTVDENGDEVLDDDGDSIAEDYYQGNRAPALAYLWWEAGVDQLHPAAQADILAAPCGDCHSANGFASQFTAYHTGYDVNISDENGARYADTYTVSIDSASYDSATGLITVEFSASDPAILPELYLSYYGYGSKNFIVAGHERDANGVDCPSSRRPGCQMEYVPLSRRLADDPEATDTNPIFTEDAASNPTDGYIVTVDPSQWQLTKTDSVPQMIADGVVRRVEIMVAPELNLEDLATPGPNVDVVLTGKTLTLNLVTGLTEDDYFKGVNAAVDTAKCNVCHDALASSFHSESGRGGDGIELCKNCHNVTYAGGHIEMASRSIDNYVHAIHSFQEFDPGDVFRSFDPVYAKRYDLHINHNFPNFTIRNCEACHTDAEKGNVPDQSASMPSLLSSSDTVATWYKMVDTLGIPGTIAEEVPSGRNIGSVPQYVTGAASRACGGCHRARLIRDDAAGDLAAWNQHTEAFGTLLENSEENDGILYKVIEKVMGVFE